MVFFALFFEKKNPNWQTQKNWVFQFRQFSMFFWNFFSIFCECGQIFLTMLTMLKYANLLSKTSLLTMIKKFENYSMMETIIGLKWKIWSSSNKAYLIWRVVENKLKWTLVDISVTSVVEFCGRESTGAWF